MENCRSYKAVTKGQTKGYDETMIVLTSIKLNLNNLLDIYYIIIFFRYLHAYKPYNPVSMEP